MPLQLDPESGKLMYRGKECGSFTSNDQTATLKIEVSFNNSFASILPLSWLAHGLSLLPENKPERPLILIESKNDDIEKEFDVPRLLTEKHLRAGNYRWAFHKNDPDSWPSELHGHEYDHGLVLDAITGRYYVKSTKRLAGKLKKKHLKTIQSQLSILDDFSAKADRLFNKE